MSEPIQMAGPWITEHEERIVLDALRNGWYGAQAYHYVETFEREFAHHHRRAHALMTPNCTSAIHLLLAGLGIGPGDEVIVPDCTWIATAAPITYVGATTVFCDIDPDNWCLSPDALAARITEHTKAIIAVDLFGNMAEWSALEEVAGRFGIPLIEDAAEALGSFYRGIPAGKFGVGSVFSFHRTKTLTTGEGGMLLLDDEALFKRCKFLRDHGRAEGRMYYNTEVTFKYMPFNLQAALGYAQFQRLDELVARKRRFLERYRAGLAGIPDLHLNAEPPHVVNAVWGPTLVFGHSHDMTKEKAIAELGALGLPARPFFYPLSSLPAYASHNANGRQIAPTAYDISARGITLPAAFTLTDEQIDAMCTGIRRILGF